MVGAFGPIRGLTLSAIGVDPTADTRDEQLCNRIADYAAHILLLDVLPSREDQLRRQRHMLNCGELLRAPLPLDTATDALTRPKGGASYTLLRQLVKRVGGDDAVFMEQLTEAHAAEPQARKIFFGVAPSGVGKTGLGYTVGQRYVYAVVIRVALQASDGGQPLLSPAFHWLRGELMRYDEARRQLAVTSVDTWAELAKQAVKLVQLVVLCYVDVTLTCLQMAAASAAGVLPSHLRELALRFSRNSVSESITLAWVRQRLAQIAAYRPYQTKIGEQLAVVDASALESYGRVLHERFLTLPANEFAQRRLLIMIDEAHAVMNVVPNLFMRHTDYVASSFSGSGTPERSSKVDPAHRGLFYILACLGCQHAEAYRWGYYFTGTTFSMLNFVADPHGMSPARGKLTHVHLTGSVTVAQMLDVLQHYLACSEELLSNRHFMECLHKCRGRPLFFIGGVFAVMCSLLSSPGSSLTSAHVVPAVLSGIETLEETFSTALYQLFVSHEKPLATGTGQTSSVLVPRLIKALWFDPDATMSLEDGEGGRDIIAQAIASSVIPQPKTMKVCFTDEPLLYKALDQALVGLLATRDETTQQPDMRGVHRILSIMFPVTTRGSPAGFLTEQVCVYYLALRIRRLQLISEHHMVSFAEAVAPLFAGPANTFPSRLDSLVLRNVHVLDAEGRGLEVLVRPDLSLNDAIIAFNLSADLGIDYVLLGTQFRRDIIRGTPIDSRARKAAEKARELMAAHKASKHTHQLQTDAAAVAAHATSESAIDESAAGSSVTEQHFPLRSGRITRSKAALLAASASGKPVHNAATDTAGGGLGMTSHTIGTLTDLLASNTLTSVASGSGSGLASGPMLDFSGEIYTHTTGNTVRAHRVCAFQSKNEKAATLNDGLLTLHPGAQWLLNAQRAAAIRGETFELVASLGADSPKWKSFMDLATRYPVLAHDWVRCFVASRDIAEPVYQFAKNLSDGYVDRTFSDAFSANWMPDVGASWTGRTSGPSARAAAESPVVLLSLSSGKWLTRDLRDVFVNPAESTLSLVRDEPTWMPLSVETVAALNEKSGGTYVFRR